MIDSKIKTFLKLCDTLNYRMAAQLLHITQPAVTQHIQALETECGCKLFCYEARKLELTPAGVRLQEYARETISRERKLLEALREPEGNLLRIGATKTIGAYLLGNMLKGFLEEKKNLADVCVDNTEVLLQMLNHDELDFAIVEGFFDKAQYGFHTLRIEPFVGICGKGHPFAKKSIPMEKIFKETLILREKGSGTRGVLEEVLKSHNYGITQFSRVLCMNDFLLIEQLVKENVGISFVYKTVADNSTQIDTFFIEGCNIEREFNYVYLKNTETPKQISLLK